MDSELASEGTVKKITEAGITGSFTAASSSFSTRVTTNKTKLDTIESGATADQSNAEIRAAVEAASDSNVFTDDDHSKLNAIEASADVTDTANVTAAGALMDSEVDADIKTLSLPASTTISAFGATLVDDADAGAARTTLGLGSISTLSSIDISSNTNLVGGTNITLDGDTLNVDDAFLKNNANDTTSGTITAAGFTTTGTWTFDDATSGTVGITTVHTGSSFTDNDTSLMTAGAIKEKIEAYGYSTADGDITSVRFVTDSGSGSAAEDTADTANFSLLGSSGVGITNSGLQ